MHPSLVWRAYRHTYINTHTYILQCVICGAEPIRVEVMQGFFEYFAKSGFNPKALMPACE